MKLLEVLDRETVTTLRHLVGHCRKVAITAHLSPDGDALGASLGLARILESMGREVRVITPDQPTHALAFLPGAKKVTAWSSWPDGATRQLAEADLVFCLDYNAPSRIDRLEPALMASAAPKVMIDHHLHPEYFGQRLTISRPDVSSTCALLFMVLHQVGMYEAIDRQAAECILTGMMTDTGNFSYNSNDPRLYAIIPLLLAKGVDKDALYQRAMNVHTESSLRLNGYALSQRMEVFPDMHAALICLDREELNRFGYQKGDTEGLVNVPLSIPGVVYSCYLRQEEDYVKVSMRSRGDFPVNRLCADHFGGGGHLNAAGGEYHGTLQDAAQTFRDLLPRNKEAYIDRPAADSPA